MVFLLSARASYITGAEIPVDGGHTSHGGTKSIVSSLIDQTGGYAAVLVLSIVFLWLRPHGLFGRR